MRTQQTIQPQKRSAKVENLTKQVEESDHSQMQRTQNSKSKKQAHV